MVDKREKICAIGIILIIIQVIAFIGMSKVQVGLYPDASDLSYYHSTEDSGLNLKKTLFAIKAGTDRFGSSFKDLKFKKYDYRVMSATQMTSAMIRDSLQNDRIGLAIYDLILTISYSFVGLVGVGVVAAAFIIKEK